jgi:hypothetical protein
LTTITPSRLAVLKKLQPPTGQAARYNDITMQVGEVVLDRNRRAMVLLNWDEQPRTLSFTLRRRSRVRELWTDGDLGDRSGTVAVAMPARSGRVFVCSSDG